ncbi:hypothetical protein GJ744_010204 [Endocarpon pusillum]|uniref:Uncharacterized protein n=1 Tax=Endocarpon pusillum TaxID=364733 RepID=A0A8H7AIG1_9EURO|nr:hypothetical protein GJ744_010204 [Endocarpon pusillum]
MHRNSKREGISLLGRYEKQHMEDFEQAHIEYERRMDGNCALLGKTREELDMEDPQRFNHDGGSAAECDCEGERPVMFLGAILSNSIVRPFYSILLPETIGRLSITRRTGADGLSGTLEALTDGGLVNRPRR